jgi:poly-beta-1,6-N-acetyl-D-glucosamine synthase
MSSMLPYVLITPARNEAAFIKTTIESVIGQTALPLKWVIVDDGSMDETASIVSNYLGAYSWIELVRMPRRQERHFAAKVRAFNAGLESVKDISYQIIGNLDADISFDSDYIEFLLNKFSESSHLGVAGTIFREEGYSSEKDSFEGHNHVAGGCQMFRKQCFEEIGGFIPNQAGGVDWIAVTTARMRGWKTRSFREKSFLHNRHLGMAERGIVASAYAYGKKDYYLGGHPLWELFRVAYRMTKRPYLVSGAALGLGYFGHLIRRTPRSVSAEVMTFHRKEQLAKLRVILKTVMRFRRLDTFNVARSEAK